MLWHHFTFCMVKTHLLYSQSAFCLFSLALNNLRRTSLVPTWSWTQLNPGSKILWARLLTKWLGLYHLEYGCIIHFFELSSSTCRKLFEPWKDLLRKCLPSMSNLCLWAVCLSKLNCPEVQIKCRGRWVLARMVGIVTSHYI